MTVIGVVVIFALFWLWSREHARHKTDEWASRVSPRFDPPLDNQPPPGIDRRKNFRSWLFLFTILASTLAFGKCPENRYRDDDGLWHRGYVITPTHLRPTPRVVGPR